MQRSLLNKLCSVTYAGGQNIILLDDELPLFLKCSHNLNRQFFQVAI